MAGKTSGNVNLSAAKTAKKDEFYISSSWKLFSFLLDENGARKISEFHKVVLSDDKS